MLFQLALAFNIEKSSLFGVPLALVVLQRPLLRFLLTGQANDMKFIAGGKL